MTTESETTDFTDAEHEAIESLAEKLIDEIDGQDSHVALSALCVACTEILENCFPEHRAEAFEWLCENVGEDLGVRVTVEREMVN